jgi:HK97 family phage major capsid protein
MTSDAKKVNVHQDGLVVYPIGESEAPDFSDTKYKQIGLVAKKFGVATKETEEFNMDSIMSWADAAVRDIAYAFAKDEDDHGFNGDGSQAYHGIWGIGPKLHGLDATPANIASIKVGAGNLWSELVLSDFNGMKAKTPTYVYDMGGIGWYCSSAFYYTVMEPLMLAAGGNKAIDLADGADARFLGFPVHFVNSMPAVEANSQICCYFGNLKLDVLFVDRIGVELKISDQVRFMEGETVMRAIERYDINYWNTGNVSSDAALQVAGPIIGLQTAAS